MQKKSYKNSRKWLLYMSIFSMCFCFQSYGQNETKNSITYKVDNVTFTFNKVEGGTFSMGATKDQGENFQTKEQPAHTVTLSDYYIGTTEITQGLWKAVMGESLLQIAQREEEETYGVGDDYPMYFISWDDIQLFLQKLNILTGCKFRLPTEAEWEFAARGGNKSKHTKFAGSDDIRNVAWFDDDPRMQTHPVATKQPNELGLYDMSGSLWEWCSDWYYEFYYQSSPVTNPQGAVAGKYRSLRGGCWGRAIDNKRISFRDWSLPDYRYNYAGCRLAISPEDIVQQKDFQAMKIETKKYIVKNVTFYMSKVYGDMFYMGATYEQGDSVNNSERPVHQVAVSDYYIGTTEVTQALWKAVMGESVTDIAKRNGWKTYGVGANYPMYDVSWRDVQEFISKLNALTGENFRLPTEAEWEFAARGGRLSKHYKYAGSNDFSEVAYCSQNGVNPVALKKPNELGLYDMSGNVFEWCSDWWDKRYYVYSSLYNPEGGRPATHRVSRGGSWYYNANYSRVSYRCGRHPGIPLFDMGFRLVLSVKDEKIKSSVYP